MAAKDELDIKAVENVKEPQVDKYHREDADKGLVQDTAEISMLRASRKYDVIANNLLGDFDQEGRYKIPDYILTDLIHIPKTQVQKVEDGLLLRAAYKDGNVFSFMLSTPVINPDGTATCILFLHETVKRTNGYIINTLTTTVGVYTYKNNSFYTENSFKAFAIQDNKKDDPDDSGALRPSHFIDARLAYLSAVAEGASEQYEQLEEKYFTRRLQILNELPEGAIILSEFAKRRALIEKYFLVSKKGKSRALNDLLTSILEQDTKSNITANPNYKTMMGDLNNKYYALTIKIAENLGSQPKVQNTKHALDSLLVKTPEVRIAGGIRLSGETPKHTESKKSVPIPNRGASNNNGGRGNGGGKKSNGGGEKKKDNAKTKKNADKPYFGMPNVPGRPSEKPAETSAQKTARSTPVSGTERKPSAKEIAKETVQSVVLKKAGGSFWVSFGESSADRITPRQKEGKKNKDKTLDM